MLRIENITYRVGGRVLFENASAVVPVGHKLGLVGRNGSGKTTLLSLIAGRLETDGGAIALRRGARLAEVAQEAPGGPASLPDTVLAADTERAAREAERERAKRNAAAAGVGPTPLKPLLMGHFSA